MPRSKKRSKEQVVGVVGIGLDSKDGHKRLTQSEYFILVGGSAETHERMQDTAIRFEEGLKERGKRLPEISPQEVVELLRQVQEG